MAGLTRKDIYWFVNRYIGVSGGYLGDFSYRTHSEFYAEYCDLDIDPFVYEGTTRERFIEVLEHADPRTRLRSWRVCSRNTRSAPTSCEPKRPLPA